MKIIVKNKKASFNYELLDKYQAGIELKGTEVKSIYLNKVSINDTYVRFKNNELFVVNMLVNNYPFGNRFNLDPTRSRKLLLHKNEIIRIIHKIKKEKLVMIPTVLYWSNNRIKLDFHLAKPKKLYDKREIIKKRDNERRLSKY